MTGTAGRAGGRGGIILGFPGGSSRVGLGSLGLARGSPAWLAAHSRQRVRVASLLARAGIPPGTASPSTPLWAGPAACRRTGPASDGGPRAAGLCCGGGGDVRVWRRRRLETVECGARERLVAGCTVSKERSRHWCAVAGVGGVDSGEAHNLRK